MSRIRIVNKDRFRTSIIRIRNAMAFRHDSSQAEADGQLLAQLGLNPDTKPNLIQVWTQESRLKTIKTIENQYFCTLVWLGCQMIDKKREWLEEFIGSVDLGAVQPVNRNLLKVMFGKVRLNGRRLDEAEIEKELAQIFNETGTVFQVIEEPEYSFQINRVYTDEDNHLYFELCGMTRTPLLFCVRNETTGHTWQALGSRLTGYCKPYRVVYDISSPKTWYSIDIMCHDGTYGAHVCCFTNDIRPYFCDDIRIEGPYHHFKRRICLP